MKPLLPALSRSYKTKQYCVGAIREEEQNEGPKLGKRKRTQQSKPIIFEVRKCNHGIGMFATQNIECGSVIIDDEDPIVSTHRAPPTRASGKDGYSTSGKCFCHFCVAPLGSLKDHVVVKKGPDDNLTLPYLDNDTGPQFTDKPILKCSDCHQVAWCSQQCAELGQARHHFLCRGTTKAPASDSSTNAENPVQCPLEAFYDTMENPSIFQLAVDGMSAILASALGEIEINEKAKSVDTSIFHFWKDYGSHPLWWDVGNSAKSEERKSQSQAFTKLLREVFALKWQQLPLLQPNAVAQLESAVAELCTLDNIGQLLGMLQCNVMEFEYLSPLEQYCHHLQQQQDEDGEQTGDSAEAARQWLRQRTDNLHADTCILGSGLYPLLTLANHDCDPNASIDFLQESNRGSMVALRDIMKGDEICIVYVPNGDLDAGGTSERFRHFEPTRTWKWLNQNCSDGDEWEDVGEDEDDNSECSDDENQAEQSDQENDEEQEDDEAQHIDTVPPEAHHIDKDGDGGVEGDDQGDRAAALLEYGFECRCKRCLCEKSDPKEPYVRPR